MGIGTQYIENRRRTPHGVSVLFSLDGFFDLGRLELRDITLPVSMKSITNCGRNRNLV